MIGQIATKFKDQLNLKPLEFPAENDRAAQGPLLYPGKVLADPVGQTTVHFRHRPQPDRRDRPGRQIAGRRSARVPRGSSTAVMTRPVSTASRECAWPAETLYVADTENHAIRAIDLKSRIVSTISGTGSQALRSPLERYVGAARTSALSSPWDIIQVPG